MRWGHKKEDGKSDWHMVFVWGLPVQVHEGGRVWWQRVYRKQFKTIRPIALRISQEFWAYALTATGCTEVDAAYQARLQRPPAPTGWKSTYNRSKTISGMVEK